MHHQLTPRFPVFLWQDLPSGSSQPFCCLLLLHRIFISVPLTVCDLHLMLCGEKTLKRRGQGTPVQQSE